MLVYFVDILIPQFLTDSLVNSIIFKVGHLHVRFWTLHDCVRGDCWHLWIGEGLQYLGHD